MSEYLQVSVPHGLMMTTGNPVLLVSQAIELDLGNFDTPKLCYLPPETRADVDSQFLELRINLAKAGVSQVSWFHIPDGDAQLLLFFD